MLSLLPNILDIIQIWFDSILIWTIIVVCQTFNYNLNKFYELIVGFQIFYC